MFGILLRIRERRRNRGGEAERRRGGVGGRVSAARPTANALPDDVRHDLFDPSWAKQELKILEEVVNAMPDIIVKVKKEIPPPKLEAVPRATRSDCSP